LFSPDPAAESGSQHDQHRDDAGAGGAAVVVRVEELDEVERFPEVAVVVDAL
jgi:hypothetical protein